MKLFSWHGRNPQSLFWGGGFLFSVAVYINFSVYLEKAFVCNRGVAFGYIIPESFFVVLWLGVIGLLSWQLYTHTVDFFARMSLGMILVGALVNILDRVLYGCVIDYIPFFHFFVFNVADTYITIGGILLLWRCIDR